MDLQLSGKRALVSGSNSGIGKEIAKVLAWEGVSVVIHGRNKERTIQVAQEIQSKGGTAFVAVGDISTDLGAQQVAEDALSALGNIDILINNAGVVDNIKGWWNTSPEECAKLYAQNTVSMIRLIQLLVPQMKQLDWGRIIQISSVGAIVPSPAIPYYSAAKAAVVNLTVSLAKELAGTGITVNTVTPGLILNNRLNEMLQHIAQSKGWGTDWAEIEKRAVQEMFPNPTGRLGQVEDVAMLVTFLASPLAGYINGANIRVDGGYVPSIN
jgi:NAD(P)-dependent dehydrogenase (short-subunit alcohol dehydrogenase family)